MSKITVVESRSVERDYGFAGVEAIIEHPSHGRLLIRDGFGGMGQPRGGAVRWVHGMVCKLQPGDTLDGLREDTRVLSAVLAGYDDTRPVLDWDGHVIAAVAKSAGL